MAQQDSTSATVPSHQQTYVDKNVLVQSRTWSAAQTYTSQLLHKWTEVKCNLNIGILCALKCYLNTIYRKTNVASLWFWLWEKKRGTDKHSCIKENLAASLGNTTKRGVTRTYMDMVGWSLYCTDKPEENSKKKKISKVSNILVEIVQILISVLERTPGPGNLLSDMCDCFSHHGLITW